MMRKPSDRLAEPFKVPPDTMDGFYWNPLAGGLSLVPAAPPPGCQRVTDRALDRATGGWSTVPVSGARGTSFYESHEHRVARLRKSTIASSRKKRRSVLKKRAAAKRSTKRKTKP